MRASRPCTTLDDWRARAEYSYNDRGRGDHITATWKLDAAGVLTEYSGYRQRLHEGAGERDFSVADGKAKWSNRTEHGDQAVVGRSVLRAD